MLPTVPNGRDFVYLLIYVLMNLDSEVAVVHHSHEVPCEVAGLCVHAAVPGTHKHLTGTSKLNRLDIKIPEHPTPVFACRWVHKHAGGGKQPTHQDIYSC